MSASKLVLPALTYKESFIAALKEFRAEDRYLYNDIAILNTEFESFVEALRSDEGYPYRAYQEWVEPVPETVLWLVKDEEYIGTVDIRHRLNWHLEKWGGHIHFVIRPSMRNKGFGKKALIKAIPIANHLGLEQALLTVAPDNKIAIHIIESCGGVFDDEVSSTDQFPARKRYWLDCT